MQLKVKVWFGENNYGKVEVQFMKIKCGMFCYELCEVKVCVVMYGDFGVVYFEGDNIDFVVIDIVCNIVYGFVKEGFESSIEEFGKEFFIYFVKVGFCVIGGFVEFIEYFWEWVQIFVQFQGYDYVFVWQMFKCIVCVEIQDGWCFMVILGIEELYVFKIIESGWENYLFDECFIMLFEIYDWVMVIFVMVKWEYVVESCDYDVVWEWVYRQIQYIFIDYYFLSL